MGIFLEVYAVSDKLWVMDSFNWFMFFVKWFPPQIHYLPLRAGVNQPSMYNGGIAEFRFTEFYLQSIWTSDQGVMHIQKSSKAILVIKDFYI